ncbi:hypothetical protein [Tabrizicola soli]|uniref:Uncharacterized protein n=1 Tax=Tabrizicola soli TaxID=2185115 RepID=A0ABV7DNQ0_9RHOB|nr:hypothetical protein [Tabrizicola soli]
MKTRSSLWELIPEDRPECSARSGGDPRIAVVRRIAQLSEPAFLVVVAGVPRMSGPGNCMHHFVHPKEIDKLLCIVLDDFTVLCLLHVKGTVHGLPAA